MKAIPLILLLLLASCTKTELLELHNGKSISLNADQKTVAVKLHTNEKDVVIEFVSSPMSFTHSDTLYRSYDSFSDFNLNTHHSLKIVIMLWVVDGAWRQAGSFYFYDCDSIQNIGGNYNVYASDPQASFKWNPVPTGFGYPDSIHTTMHPYIAETQQMRWYNNLGGSYVISQQLQPIVTDTITHFEWTGEWYY